MLWRRRERARARVPCPVCDCSAFLTRQLHRPAGSDGLIDRHHDLDVLQTFLAGYLGGPVLQDAERERIELGREMIDLRKLERLAVAAHALDTAVVERRI